MYYTVKDCAWLHFYVWLDLNFALIIYTYSFIIMFFLFVFCVFWFWFCLCLCVAFFVFFCVVSVCFCFCLFWHCHIYVFLALICLGSPYRHLRVHVWVSCICTQCVGRTFSARSACPRCLRHMRLDCWHVQWDTWNLLSAGRHHRATFSAVLWSNGEGYLRIPLTVAILLGSWEASHFTIQENWYSKVE